MLIIQLFTLLIMKNIYTLTSEDSHRMYLMAQFLWIATISMTLVIKTLLRMVTI